ncbi:MAG: D-alanyl-D-alanine carboxypeptidase [Lachnospiraceae bacterium]|nr:D-alanyl-D-alanine carboxypeptidase [Lachnospiraceae bacterium]
MKKIITSILIFVLVFLSPHGLPIAYAEEVTDTEFVEESSESTESEDETTEEFAVEEKDENGFPVITCQSAIVMDAKTGQVIYEKDAYSKQFPASTTKIMTALIALEHGNMSDTLVMSENAIWGIDRDSSNIGLDVGEKISMLDGMYAILMSSANEVCVATAEHISGSTDAYVALMNEKAKELGCTSTNFVNVNGLHHENHYTCAYDLAIMARAALGNPTFREMSACTYYEVPPTNVINDTRYLWQNNELICETSDYYYSYCTGGKTGFTDQAGGTLVSWASYNDMELICVVMNTQPKNNIFADSIKLYDYMFYNYYHHSFLQEFEFSPEQLTDVQKVLNDYYGCENAGKLQLHADTNQELLVNYNTDPESFWNSLTLSTERIDEGIIGTLSIHDSNITYIKLPVYFSGYVRSDDPEAIRAAYADGTLRKIPEYKTTSIIKKLAIWIIVLALILLFLPIRITASLRNIIFSKFTSKKKKKKRR